MSNTRNNKKKKLSKEHKEKARWRHIFKTYGLTKDQWYEIYNKQDGKCYLCERTEKKIRSSRSKYLTVDHCHVTGKIRGLLCVNCNGAILPPFEKDHELALRILKYLLKNNHYGIVPNHKEEK